MSNYTLENRKECQLCLEDIKEKTLYCSHCNHVQVYPRDLIENRKFSFLLSKVMIFAGSFFAFFGYYIFMGQLSTFKADGISMFFLMLVIFRYEYKTKMRLFKEKEIPLQILEMKKRRKKLYKRTKSFFILVFIFLYTIGNLMV